MIDALKSKKCSACTACAEACPVNAISMIKDEEGFSYPTVDMEKCIDCGKCDKVCPSITPPGFNNEPDVYALQNKNSEVLRKSQSGGAFFAIAEEIFSRGGVVYGAAFD